METPNCKIETFGKMAIYKMATKDAHIDEELKTVQSKDGKQYYKRAPFWMVLGGRYFIFSLLAFLFINFGSGMLQTVNLMVSAFIYLVISNVYYKFGRRVAIISLLPLPVTYLILSFGGSDFINQATLVQSFNIIFLNLVGFGFVNILIHEIVNKDYENWIITSPVFAYVRVVNPKFNLKFGRNLNTLFLMWIFVFGVVAYPQAKERYEERMGVKAEIIYEENERTQRLTKAEMEKEDRKSVV